MKVCMGMNGTATEEKLNKSPCSLNLLSWETIVFINTHTRMPASMWKSCVRGFHDSKGDFHSIEGHIVCSQCNDSIYVSRNATRNFRGQGSNPRKGHSKNFLRGYGQKFD